MKLETAGELDSVRGDLVPNVRKIAVLRANALGDFIFILPTVDALRAAYPEAEIVLLGKEWHAPFLEGRPGSIDRVVVVPPSRGVSENGEFRRENPAEMEAFFQAMQQEDFDLALQVHGGGTFSNPFLLRLGARFTAGLKGDDAPPLDRWIPYIYFQSEILRFLEVASLVGAHPVSLEPNLTITATDLTEAADVVPDTGRRLVALHPGAGDPGRRWPAEKFAAVGDALAAAGAEVVVTGTEDERPLVEAVLTTMTAEAHNACGQLSIGGLAGLLWRCRVVVSNDSGPLHLARAVGARTVGIYWCFNLINAGPFVRGRHRPAISWRTTCPSCERDQTREPCRHQDSYVADVTVEEVAASALDLFCR